MPDQAGRFRWILRLARITLTATLVLIGLAMAWTISQIIVAVMDTDASDWRETFPLAMSIVGQLVLAAWLFVVYGLIRALISNAYSTASTAARVGRLESVASNQNEAVHKLLDLASLSDEAKSLLFRDREMELMREQIQADLVKEDYRTAEAFIQRIETRFGYADEATRLRQDVENFREASEQEKIDAAVATLEQVLQRHDWARAAREAERLAKVFIDSEKVAALPERIRQAQIQHKRELLQQYGEAVGKNDVDDSIELLRSLDPYLSPQEAAAMQESARDVFKRKLHNLGVQFAIFVNDQQWPQAIATGEEIIREYPNTRMAQEVREKMERLRTLAEQSVLE